MHLLRKRYSVFYRLFAVIIAIFCVTGISYQNRPVQAANLVSKVTIASGTRYATPMYIIDSGRPGPVVMVTGGVHGNEPAGYQAADKVKSFNIIKGKLLVIPYANKLAVAANDRTAPGIGDLNRSFPTSSGEPPDNDLAAAIWKAVIQYQVQWLIDLHEGYDYHRLNPDSVGQTLIYYPIGSASSAAQQIITTINIKIPGTDQDYLLLRYPVKGSLARSTGQLLGVQSMIFESCSKQNINTRVNQHLTAVQTLLKYLKMQ